MNSLFTESAGVLFTFSIWIALGYCVSRYLAAALLSPFERGYIHWSDRIFGSSERFIARLSGFNPEAPMNWKQYAIALLTSNFVMCVMVFLGLSFMGSLPLNPDENPSMSPDLAFNTTASFISNTNIQHYSGESGMSYLGQIAMLMFFQFTSAATGLAVFAAICRALRNRENSVIGNFYGDALRSLTRVLLPFSVIIALFLVSQGVPMTWEGKAEYTSLEGEAGWISRGPVAAFIAIKHLGTNGGGFLGVNTAHPFESPSYLTNIVLVTAELLLPLACVWAFGIITGRRKVANAIFATMMILFVGAGLFGMHQEWSGNQVLESQGVNQPIGNLEGKELRFGTLASAYFGHASTATSTGAVNAMHDSFTPLGGLVPLFNMWINCVFGGDGVGFINMLIYVIITVFIAGLMVGRTPEFMGKKIEVREVKLAALALIAHPILILGFTAVTTLSTQFSSAASNPGSHGFSQMLYEFTSAAANNGSGFEGLGDNTPWWNITCGIVMLLGRYIPIIAPLALAANLGMKKTVPESTGTLRTDSALFVLLLLSIIFVIGALLFLPVAVLGPIAEFLSQF